MSFLSHVFAVDSEQCTLHTEKAYKTQSSQSVYYVTSDCTKRPFSKSTTFFTYFDTWNDVIVDDAIETIPNDTLGFMPKGPKYDPQYGALVKTLDDTHVYLLLGNEKYWISSADIFSSLGYQWDWIEDVDTRLLDKYTVGSEIDYSDHHPNFTLVKYPDDSRIYRLEADSVDSKKQVKRHVSDEATFATLGFRWDRIVEISSEEVYEDGDALGEQVQEIVKESDVSPEIEQVDESLVESNKKLPVYQDGSQASPCTDFSVCSEYLDISEGYNMLFFRSFSLKLINRSVTHVVVVVHGSSRNADYAFEKVVDSAQSENHLGTTLIIAPQYRIRGDDGNADEFVWLNGSIDRSWRTGGNAPGTDVSSFDVVDRLLEHIVSSGLFPNVKKITITGHSAGGQFVNRYAAGSSFETMHPGYTYHYVPANPSSWMYLNDVRPLNGSYVVPDTCLTYYNSYKYGMEDRNVYMSRLGDDTIRAQYLKRNVTYLLGEKDTKRTDNFDTSCEADLQGLTRISRGLLYFQHINTYYPNNNHTLVRVPNVGHGVGGMYGSPEGKRVLWQ